MSGPRTQQPGPAGATLAELLATGEREALRGTPASALAPLGQALDIAARGQREAEGMAAGWLLGVALGACGRYGEALAVLDPLSAAVGGAVRGAGAALFGSLAAATSASLHRQLGRPEQARELDAAGWATAAPLGAAVDEAKVDCALGLASDMVGVGEHDLAEQWVERAAGVIAARSEPGWRSQVRLQWVRAEIALLDDAPEDAAGLAEEALRLAERARAPRHVAKSLLFRGVAQATAGSAQAVPTLRRAAALAEGLGARPLVWPARAMLAALLAPAGQPELAQACAVVRDIAGDVPEGLRAGWLARPDVAALVAAAPAD